MSESDYFLQVLQKRIGEYFNQSLVYEARFQQQNDIISAQNEKIEELNKAIGEYQAQINHFDEALKKQASKPTRKKPTSTPDGGTF